MEDMENALCRLRKTENEVDWSTYAAAAPKKRQSLDGKKKSDVSGRNLITTGENVER